MKMKVGLGPNEDLKLVQAVRETVGKDFKLMVDANHAYNLIPIKLINPNAINPVMIKVIPKPRRGAGTLE